MASVGDSFPVGSTCPETGQYKHAACANTNIYNKGDKFAPCQMGNCPNKGADWKLVKKLT